MNYIKEQDIIDKSRLALTKSLSNTMMIKELPNENIPTIDGILEINSIKFPYVVIVNPSIGKVETIVKEFDLTSFNLNKKNLLFILEYASKELANFFRKKKIFFLDSAGNCFINHPQLFISNQGNNKINIEPFRAKRSFQKTGLKLLYELFKKPKLISNNYREISAKTNISLASIGYIFEELKDDGHIISINDHKRQLTNINRLIVKWANSYYNVLRPIIHRGYFARLDNSILRDDNLLIRNEDAGVFYGGEYGAYKLNGIIKPKKLIIYTNLRLSTLAKRYKIVPIGKYQKNVNKIEILESFWSDKVNSPIDEIVNIKTEIVDPILIYADLINSNNYRCIEAAEEILNNEIRNKFIRLKLQW